MTATAKRFVLLTLVIVGSFAFLLPSVARAELKGATILSPKEEQSVVQEPLLITGVAPAGSKIYFWYDGRLVGGYATKKKTKSGIASFSFRFGKALTDGKHTVEAQVVKGSEKSITSKVTFTVPHARPRRIDGVWVLRSEANRQPVGVMIENLSIVRPQSGLQAASVVYEALAEGGVPRFLAVYASRRLPTIGPVRSARPYYVDWAKEYNAALMHAGGSRDAFHEFGKLRVRSIDALVNRTARYFYRRGGFVSTHNLFTDQTQISRMLDAFQLTEQQGHFVAWKFKDEAPLEKRLKNVASLTIEFGRRADRVDYRYDRGKNWYWRNAGGVAHRDATRRNEQIHVKNVVVQFVPKERVIDRKGHLDLQITGKGSGLLLADGRRTSIVWKKSSPSGRTRFFLRNGKEIRFNRGNIWIEVVPKGKTVR